MKAPQIPRTEMERLEILRSYEVLDTPPEPEYDDITRIAAQICGTPIALISLVDKDRQWFKSRQGLEAAETPRAISFCGHAINTPNQLFEVQDATLDERFQDNPLVISDPEVIYYLGSPIVAPNGEALGTLCVIDHKPHEVSAEAKATLQLLSRQVVCQLELKKQNLQLETINGLLKEEILHRKRKERQLVQARDAAIQAGRVKDQFLSNVSHEIRTPLNGVIGISKLLLQDQSLSPTNKDLLQDLDFSANHLLRIINDILDLMKIKEGLLNFENIDFQLTTFLGNLYRLLAINAREKGIELHLEIDPHLPALVNGDASRLGQILLNIAGNAIKFTSEGSVNIHAQLLAQSAKSSHIQFEIMDTGIGIPAEKIDSILDPFTQSDNSIARKYGGTGLGLSIAKQLIERFGGKLEIESVYGQGSTFRFDIQLKPPVQVTEKTSDANSLAGTDQRALNRALHLLVVEDNIMNQKVAQKHLHKFGFSTHIVSNGQEALQALEEQDFDLILMDINMPIMDGMETTRRIRQSKSKYQHISILGWTASILSDETQRIQEVGMDDFVSKPFNPKELYGKIINLSTKIKA